MPIGIESQQHGLRLHELLAQAPKSGLVKTAFVPKIGAALLGGEFSIAILVERGQNRGRNEHFRGRNSQIAVRIERLEQGNAVGAVANQIEVQMGGPDWRRIGIQFGGAVQQAPVLVETAHRAEPIGVVDVRIGNGWV